MSAPLAVQELIDMLRDNEHRGYSYALGRYDCGVLADGQNNVRIEGRYNLEAVVKKINERMATDAKD